jgi:hypothetical protein
MGQGYFIPDMHMATEVDREGAIESRQEGQEKSHLKVEKDPNGGMLFLREALELLMMEELHLRRLKKTRRKRTWRRIMQNVENFE